jgi:very-short-patch-repair endonuclease
MVSIPRSVLDAARERHGLVVAADLRAARIVGRARSDALNSGLLVPVHRGVYRLGSHHVTFEMRCAAACLAAPDAAIAGPTAARLVGLRKVFTDNVHLIARRAITLDGIDAHRTDLLSSNDVTVIDGLRILRAGRLLCDLAAHLDDAALESVIEQALDRRMISLPTLRWHAARFIAPGRPGSVRLRRVLESRPVWLRPADSDLELRLWRALRGRGLDLERQVSVALDGGETVVIDLAVRSCRFGIEVDHVTWHGGRLDAQRDKRRDRMLLRVGWMIARVTDEDIEQRLDQTVDQLVAIAKRCIQQVG